MIEVIGIIVTVLSVTGVVLNNRKRIGCFAVWIISNALSMIIHIHTATWSLAARDLIFIALAIEGILLWKRMDATNAAGKNRKP